MKKKNFLVTGGTGFIGSSISNLLVNKGHNVKIFDNNSRGNVQKIKKLKKKIKFFLLMMEKFKEEQVVQLKIV